MEARLVRLASEVFQAAVDIPGDQRDEFIRARCNGDTTLLALVQGLLRADAEQTTGPLDTPLFGQTPSVHPTRLGTYELVGVLGEGGMAVVYEARQEQPRRTVAIKVLRAAAFSREMLRRFEHEAHVLGQLQHPGIAHIYEAGVALLSGGLGGDRHQPYYVMELIRGKPLTAYADAASLDTNARLDLLARVCDAVQYAHQRGVIHRDLKPANILVAEHDTSAADSPRALAGQPKVLDFGVARVTSADPATPSMNTEAGRLIGTLAYMSPEQLGGDVDQTDTRSDVYALGVILYELLAGKLPHDLSGLPLPEAVRRVREEEPRPLGTLHRRFRGEIETIVARAMEKDRDRRYASALDLAADIRRYLRGEAILARADSAIYVLRKSLYRHRAPAVVAVALLLALSAFAVYAWSQARTFRKLSQDEHAASLAASREADKARLVNDFLKGVFELANPDPAREHDLTLTDVLDEATERLQRGALASRPDVEAEVRATLAKTYDKLELMDAALVHFDWLRSHARTTFGPRSTEYLQALQDHAGSASEAGLAALAIADYQAALDLATALFGKDSARVADLQNDLGNCLMRAGKPAEGLPLALASIDGFTRLFGPDSQQVAFATFNLAGIYRSLSRTPDAEIAYLRAIPVLEREMPGSISTIRCRWSYAHDVLRKTKRLDEAEVHLRETIAVAAASLGPAHAETIAAERILAGIFMDKGEFVHAAEILADALRECRAFRRWVILGERTVVVDYARCLAALGLIDQARDELRTTVQRLEAIHGREHEVIFRTLEHVAAFERDRGELDLAGEILDDVLVRACAMYGEQSPRYNDWRRSVARLRATLK
ncbi:MAG: hypothetical protein HBSAPP03_06710 [Phycisphaerae bacterium]|nr:MAG: hypothetical protein HBSAPP03_06710 [Phycisphaerae bacterium]